MNPNQPRMSALPKPVQFSQTTSVKCEKCSSTTFYHTFFIRKVSRLLSGADQDGYQPIDTFACTQCNNVNEEFIPKDLRDEMKSKIIS